MLEGRHIVILGGSSGIGFAVAEAAIAAGATVRIGSTNADKIEAEALRLGASASVAVVDTTDEASLEDFLPGTRPSDHLYVTAGGSLTRKGNSRNSRHSW